MSRNTGHGFEGLRYGQLRSTRSDASRGERVGEMRAQPEVLRSWSVSLQSAVDELDATAHGAPEPPNTGRCTAMTSAGLAQLFGGIAALSEGITAMSEAVGESSSTYAHTDERAAGGN